MVAIGIGWYGGTNWEATLTLLIVFSNSMRELTYNLFKSRKHMQEEPQVLPTNSMGQSWCFYFPPLLELGHIIVVSFHEGMELGVDVEHQIYLATYYKIRLIIFIIILSFHS